MSKVYAIIESFDNNWPYEEHVSSDEVIGIFSSPDKVDEFFKNLKNELYHNPGDEDHWGLDKKDDKEAFYHWYMFGEKSSETLHVYAVECEMDKIIEGHEEYL